MNTPPETDTGLSKPDVAESPQPPQKQPTRKLSSMFSFKESKDEEDILSKELDVEGKLYLDGLIQDVILLGAPVSNKVMGIN
jgi:hypothetical protein